jgi:signal transduction histidine kinase
VLQAVATGERNKEIALRLNISPRTVKAHLTSVYNKLGVDSRGAAIAIAAQSHGLYYPHMTENQATPKREVWEQWDWVWHVAAYAIFGVYIAIKFGSTSPTSRLLPILGLSALLAVWYIRFVITPPMRWQDNPRRGLLYFIVGFLLWGGLFALDANALMLTGMFIPMIFTRFPIRWAIAIVFSQGLVLFLLYTLIYSPENWFVILIIVLGLLLIGILMSVFISALIGQSVERQQLVEQKEKVIDLMRENRELEEAYLQQEIMLRQSEKLATLGKLSAGVAHELNNPASAAQRAVSQLEDSIFNLEQAEFGLGQLDLSPSHLKALEPHTQLVYQRVKEPILIDSLTRSDQEYEIETWLDENGVEDGWEYAPTLVSIGYTPQKLTELAQNFPGEKFQATVSLLCNLYTTRNLMNEIGQGMGRITDIVKALKSYTYLDQAPIQSIDIHEGLENTLVILRSKIGEGIVVHRDYANELPRINAYGSEVNQVWTNIIDNAIYALDGQGDIFLKTYQENSWVVVEIKDTGPGIPQDIQNKIFDPFFTTKPPGDGAGLGLNISHNIIVQKHKGMLTDDSRPGDTCFTVKLPVNLEA